MFVWLIPWTPCRAQNVVLHLRNGDRLTGIIQSDATNTVTIMTAFGANISVPISQIERRETPAGSDSTRSAAEGRTAQPKAPVTSPSPGVAQPKTAPPASAPNPKPAETQKAKGASFRKFLSEWKGDIDLGMNLGFSTTERQAYSGRLKLTHARTDKNQHLLKNTLDYLASYGTADGILSENRMDGSWKIEYGVGKRFLLYNAAGAGYDEIRKIDAQYDVGPGVGYKWITRTNFVLTTELGGNYQEQYFADKTGKSRYSLRLAEEAWWQFSSRLRLDEKIEFFPEIRDLSHYRVRLETNLSHLLRQNLTLKLSVIDLYDTEPPSNVSQNDLQIRSSIGIRF
jgi:putative salt-induced outer membrane protein YdiY